MSEALLLNIGNTASSLAIWEGGLVRSLLRQETPLLLEPGWAPAPLTANPALPIVAACVVPAVRQALTSRFGDRITWLQAANAPGLDFSLVDARTIGADRVANALAAVHGRPLPAIIIDAGTAITFETVDQRRHFRGGAILPGRRLSRRALAQGTGQLPDIELSDELPAALGRTTREAILAGIDLGTLGAVERLLTATRRELGEPELAALIVGGDRHFFASHLPNVVLGPEDFTMRGLGALAETLAAAESPSNGELLL